MRLLNETAETDLMTSNPLRNLPAVDAVLSHPRVMSLNSDLPAVQIKACVRSVLAQQTVRAAQSLVLRRLRRVINATGIVLHTNLGRAPLSEKATERISQAAQAANLELDLESGRRSRRGAFAEELLCRLTGAPAALIVNNCAAATMLALQGVAAGKEVIISRGQLVEIGGGFRLPDVFAAAGVTLREVGTANRTHVSDYAEAVSDQTAAILRVHRSNFRLSGFVSEPSVAELVTLARQHELLMIDDLGSGCLTSLSPLGLHEPDVESSLKADSDLLLFSGDKLLGGPQAGVLLGKSDWIERLRRHPLARATRVCKLTLAALEATLQDHLSGQAFAAIPALRMLATDADEIGARCAAVVQALSDTGLELCVTASQAEVGGGSLADQAIPGFAVCIGGDHCDRTAHWLRTQAEVPILGRIEDGTVLLDLRTVLPAEDGDLISTLRQLADATSAGTSR